MHRVMSLYGPYELGVATTMCLFVSLFSFLDRAIAWYLTLISESYFIVIIDLWRYCYLKTFIYLNLNPSDLLYHGVLRGFKGF